MIYCCIYWHNFFIHSPQFMYTLFHIKLNIDKCPRKLYTIIIVYLLNIRYLNYNVKVALIIHVTDTAGLHTIDCTRRHLSYQINKF